MTRIYLTDLAAYNEGFLIGEWIDLPCDNLNERLKAILKKGDEVCLSFTDHEEYFITDSESPFEINEYSSLDKINELAEQFEQLDETEIKKIKFLEQNGETTEQALEKYEDISIYEDMTFEDLAYELVEESWSVPEHLINYINYDLFARELEADYTMIDNDLFFNQY